MREETYCNTYFVQVGVVVYGEDAKTGFLLNQHSNTVALVEEILSIPFNNRPGNNIGHFVPFVSYMGLFSLKIKWNFLISIYVL